MDVIEQDERELTQYALERFMEVPTMHIYGSHRLEVADRIGVITFNLTELPHGLVAAALNDYFGVAMRNQCFCAQPFVRQLLGVAGEDGVAPDSCIEPGNQRLVNGMVRASFGLYNTRADVDKAVAALTHIAENADAYQSKYEPVLDGSGDWKHTSFTFDPDAVITLEGEVDAWLAGADV
jgi:selenocysteine lyase/cysteine desulfurase